MGKGGENALQVKVEMLERLVEELRRDREKWMEMAMNLEAKFAALPAPTSRRR